MNPFRSFPLFFSISDNVVNKVLDKDGDLVMCPFPMDEAHHLLNEAKAAKTDREALVKIGELMMKQQEHNNNNIMRTRNKLNTHMFGNKVCFWVLASINVVEIIGIGYIVTRWLGA